MIRREITDQLRPLCRSADEEGVFNELLLKIIFEQKWFKIFVPRSFGGLELSLPEGLQLEEQLAAIDGSLGWTATLCSGASQFIGYLNTDLAALFHQPDLCIGGSGAVTGIARETKNGYLINGSWKYATGAPYCSHFTANCQIERNGALLLDEKGLPVSYSFLFERSEVVIDNKWDAMGLKATASYNFSVTDVNVAHSRRFQIAADCTTLPHPLFKFPFLQFAEATLAVNTLGMAQHFLSVSLPLIQSKAVHNVAAENEHALLQNRWKMADNLLYKLRGRFYAAVNRAWESLLKEQSVPAELLDEVSRISKGLTKSSREMVADLYPYCGVSGTQTGSITNQIFRDIFTASQHLLLNT